ncbi:hypothetical protein K0M31_018569 [Melipona bicolor]|uniref:Uncharacterized protein n=1 Tax=Melipona bicolor TaxID=60889 RepID=A0AA40G3V5_9HYME|nr:hypothetical protein K0M31_018569 [Melipona bicolor]
MPSIVASRLIDSDVNEEAMCGLHRWIEETIVTVNRDGTRLWSRDRSNRGLQSLERCRLRSSRLIETKFASPAKYCCLYTRGNCYLYLPYSGEFPKPDGDHSAQTSEFRRDKLQALGAGKLREDYLCDTKN